MRNLKFWLFAVLGALLLTAVATCKKRNDVIEENEMQKRIENHSEITESTLHGD